MILKIRYSEINLVILLHKMDEDTSLDYLFEGKINTRGNMSDEEYIAVYLTAGNAKDGSGILTLGSMCLESLPCQHDVFINGVEQPGNWNASDVYRWCIKHGATLPRHVADFAERYPNRV